MTAELEREVDESGGQQELKAVMEETSGNRKGALGDGWEREMFTTVFSLSLGGAERTGPVVRGLRWVGCGKVQMDQGYSGRDRPDGLVVTM